MYSETFDHSKKGKQVKVYSESSNASQSSKIPNPKVVNRSGSGSSSDSERQIDDIITGKSGDSNYSSTHVNGTKSLSLSSESSRSSCLSESSSDDFFPMDALKLIASDVSAIASKSRRKNGSSIDSSAKFEVDNRPPLPTSTYQVYKQKGGMSPIMSPPMQVMNRSGRYDSSRIPASVFERNNNNPLDWSIASNESLFSLHIGQNSFSRDTFKFAESTVSGEVTKSDELNMFNRMPSVTIEEIDLARASVDVPVEVENLPKTKTSDEPSNLEQKLSEDQKEIKTFHQNEIKTLRQAESFKSSPKTSSSSVFQEGRSIAHTFVPLKKRSSPFCFCCNCSRPFCSYKWSNCCHRKSNCCHTWSNCCLSWPSCKCSCGGLLSCCCSSCSHTKSSGRASPILTDRHSEGSSNSSGSCWYCCLSKPASEVTSNSSSSCWSCHWFRCFSCPSCTFKVSCTRWKCCC